MEITLDRLKMIIGDQACQINILQTEKAQLMQAYQKLKEENEDLKCPVPLDVAEKLSEIEV